MTSMGFSLGVWNILLHGSVARIVLYGTISAGAPDATMGLFQTIVSVAPNLSLRLLLAETVQRRCSGHGFVPEHSVGGS